VHEYIDNLKSDGYKKEALSLLDFVNLKVSKRTIHYSPSFPAPPKGIIPMEFLGTIDPHELGEQLSVYLERLLANLYVWMWFGDVVCVCACVYV
jgi:hypothetical protein